MNIQDVPDELVEQIVKIRNSPEYHHHFTYNKTNSLKSRQLWQSLIQTLNLPWSVYDLNSKYKNLMRTYKKNIIIARTSGEHNIKWRFWDIMKKYVKFYKDDMYHTIINIDDDQSVMKINGNDITNEISGLNHNIDVLNGEIERYIMGMEIEESVDEREMLKRLVKDVDEIKKCMKMVMQKLSKM